MADQRQARDYAAKAQNEEAFVQGGENEPLPAAGIGHKRGRGQATRVHAPVQALGMPPQPNAQDFNLNQFLPKIAAMQTNLVEMQNLHIEQMAQQQQMIDANADRDIILEYMSLKPTEFDSFGDALDFLEEVERNTSLLQANERQSILLVKMSMKGLAKDWFGRVIQPKMGQLTWKEFVTLYKEFFLPFDVTESYRERLLALNKGDRSVQEYVTEFFRLSRFAPDLMMDPVCVNSRFVEGLGPEFICLLTKVSRDLVHVINIARQMETSLIQFGKVPDPTGQLQARNGNTSVVTSALVQFNAGSFSGPQCRNFKKGKCNVRFNTPGAGLSSRSSRSAGTLPPVCHNCRRRHYGVCHLATEACFVCGRHGHFARECPMAGQQSSSASVAQPFYQQPRPTYSTASRQGPLGSTFGGQRGR